MADTYNSWSRTSRSYESKNRFSPFLRSLNVTVEA